MDLILWRHAEAYPHEEEQEDLHRPLTAKGQRQAKRVAEWLNRVLPERVRILASPAARTVQTADALGRRYKVCPSLSPGNSVEALLAEARWPSAREATLVVGHQPTLGLCAAYLMGCEVLLAEDPWRLKKGGVWWLRARTEEDGRLTVSTVAVRSPELL